MIAETIVKALGGRNVGADWVVRCPAHDDRNPSLSISTGKDGKVLLHCHAGCDQSIRGMGLILTILSWGELLAIKGEHHETFC